MLRVKKYDNTTKGFNGIDYQPNEFVQSDFSDGFLMKYLNMIIYYKLWLFSVQYWYLAVVGLGCY
jgi:hypothetical protein